MLRFARVLSAAAADRVLHEVSMHASPHTSLHEPLPVPVPVVADLQLSPDGRILECSPSAAELLGLSASCEAEGVHLSLFCREADRLAEALGAAAVTGRLERWDADLVRLDGKPLAAVVDLVATFEAPRTLTSIRVAIKPVTAWPAAAGPTAVPARRDEASQLSHELNNLLAIISGYAECLVTPSGQVDADAVEAIRRAVTSAAQVSGRVKALGQLRDRSARAVDIDAILAAVQDELRRTFGHRLAVTVQPAPHPWTVSIDRAVVQHALAALAAEAIETMPHGGTLTFRTMNVEVGPRRGTTHVGARPGRYVRVEVTYLTTGVPVTARPQRRETDDAGLAAVEALRRAGGRLIVDSDGVRVASLVVLLPSDGVTVLKPRTTELAQPTGCTVVLVEHDATQRRLLQAVFRGQGHDVEVADAVTQVEALLDRLDRAVLVTDALPGATPAAGAAWLIGHPALRVLGTSDAVARALALVTGPVAAAVIARPLAARRLTDAITALLAGDATGAGGDDLATGARWFKLDRGQPIQPLEAS